MIATRVQRRLRTVVTAALLMMSLGDANSIQRWVDPGNFNQLITFANSKITSLEIIDIIRNNTDFL